MSPVSGFVDFCERVLRVRLTSGQRVAALVAVDNVDPDDLTGVDRDLARKLFGDVDKVPSRARGVVLLLKGARVGGSYIFGGLYSLWRALTANLSSLAPGEQATALVVAPDTRLGRQVLRYALGAAKVVPTIAQLIESESSDSFTIRRPDGQRVAIEVLPATRGGSALRGRSLVSSVLTEAAFFRDEGAVVNDQELFRACAPRVLAGGLVIIETTAWAEAGLAYDLFRVNFGAPSACLVCWAPTLLMRPDRQTAALVARETERDPENARREFGAEFMAYGSGLFFDGGAIDRALAAGAEVRVNAPSSGHVAIGGDLGLVRDASGFVAVHAGDFFDIAEIFELRPQRAQPLKLSRVCAEACEFAGRHGARLIHVDHHVLQPALEHMPEGFSLEPVEGGQDAKVERYTTVRNLLNEGRIRIPRAYTRLANQLREVLAKPMPGGGLSISLPRRAGVHGDVGASFVIGVHAAATGGGTDYARMRAINDRLNGGADFNPYEPPLPGRHRGTRFSNDRSRGFG
jgi:hypothetical protein